MVALYKLLLNRSGH